MLVITKMEIIKIANSWGYYKDEMNLFMKTLSRMPGMCSINDSSFYLIYLEFPL
jgi:hypothetical protein